jgi:hypothetical protein
MVLRPCLPIGLFFSKSQYWLKGGVVYGEHSESLQKSSGSRAAEIRPGQFGPGETTSRFSGSFYLRYFSPSKGKRVWENVGQDCQSAKSARAEKERFLKLKTEAGSVGINVALPGETRLSISDDLHADLHTWRRTFSTLFSKALNVQTIQYLRGHKTSKPRCCISESQT